MLIVVYRPPKPNSCFLSDLAELLTQLSSVSTSILLMGDFNMHIDYSHSKIADYFLSVLDCCDFPTLSGAHYGSSMLFWSGNWASAI